MAPASLNMAFKGAQHLGETAHTSTSINLTMASDNETVRAILDRLFTTGDSNAQPVILPNSAMAAPPRRRVEITDFYLTSGTGIELTVLGRTALEFEDARFDAEMRADNLEMERLGLQCKIDRLNEQIADKDMRLNHNYWAMTQHRHERNRMYQQLDQMRAHVELINDQINQKDWLLSKAKVFAEGKDQERALKEKELNLQVKKNMWLAKERERLQGEQDRVWQMVAELQAQNAVLKRKLEVSKGREKSLKTQVKYLLTKLKDSLVPSKETVE